MEHAMRRKERALTREAALEVVDKAPYGSMAMLDADGSPYCVVKSFVRGGDTLFFHGAQQGQTPDCLRKDGRVCVSFVSQSTQPPDDFTTKYSSAVVFGTARELTDAAEKIEALRVICRRWTPANMANFDDYAAPLVDHTCVWKIHIDRVTGKSNAE
jgi:nitroimidazol reductase NimA-like FMN-containing flavoprotein (pyridoxamine 5'-phosphate oxidase superfamily)